jgi:YD repeat-containing protein
VRSIVDTSARQERASRAELGVIELVHGKGPSGVKGWVATFSIDQPLPKVWKVLSDCRNFPKVLKGVASCKLLSEEGEVKHHHMVLTHPDKAYMETRTEYDQARRRTSWRMTRGSFRAAEGGISLETHPRHKGWTRVTYAYYLNISAVLPESFEVPRVRRSVRRMAQEIQTYFTDSPARPGAKAPRRP